MQTKAPRASMSDRDVRALGGRRPSMYLVVLGVWTATVVWFGQVLVDLVRAGDTWWIRAMTMYFVLFVSIAWLYGIYNLSVIVFATLHRRRSRRRPKPPLAPPTLHTIPPVAVLYTTYNDFSEDAARSCVELDYPEMTVYLLDDSTDPAYQRRVDSFAALHPGVEVVRRESRSGFKAGNLNHALDSVVDQPYFVVVDADERMPSDFLTRLVPRIAADDTLGFIQANHRSMQDGELLQQDMYVGVDVHWKWYQPLRNQYGFVMFLGHGAILRREAWRAAGGFPHMVSEDLAFAIAAREQGYVGQFAEDVVCLEEFPDSVRNFRRRHVKWSRGTAEFLDHYVGRLVRSRRITTAEKLDILLPTINLPLTLCFFVFMFVAGVALPIAAGQAETMTVDLGATSLQMPVFRLPASFDALHRWDLYAVTLLTILSPVLAFALDLWRTPVKLARFLVRSTALYATLAPLTAIAVVGYITTKKAQFIVTGDRGANQDLVATAAGGPIARLRSFMETTNPDSRAMHRAEYAMAGILVLGAVLTLQLALIGLGVGYAVATRMHRVGWASRGMRKLTWAPALGITTSTMLSSASLVGVQPALFGMAIFHF